MSTALIIPLICAVIIIAAAVKKVDIFGEFTAGAAENLKTCAALVPTLIALITAIGMFRASGANELITNALSDLFAFFGFPPECLPLALIRSISGSGAIAVYEAIIKDCSPDSFAGRAASVMMGSSETTFYVIAVYFGAVNIKKTRHALPAALAGDLAGIIISVLTVNIILGR